MFSSVAGTPTKLSNKGVAERSGHNALTRMPSLPYSAASPFVAWKVVSRVDKIGRFHPHVGDGSFACIVPVGDLANMSI